MRKFTFLLSLLFAMTTMAQTTGYDVNYTGTKKNSDRPVNYVKVQSSSYGNQNYELTPAETLESYVDQTSTITFKVGAGETVTPTIGYGGEWMHAYVYIDANGDGTFTAGIGEDGYTPTGDLVSYSAYNTDPDGGGQWHNSVGENNGNRTASLPTFTAPTEMGTYRIRFKMDWNCIDPAGNTQTGNDLWSNRGSIVDVMLEVAEQQEPQAEQLFQTTTVTDGQFAAGTVWYTMQIGANGYVISNNGTANKIALSEVISDATADAQLWAFTGDNTNGYKLYNKEAGAAKVLAAPTSMLGTTGGSSFPIVVDAENIPAGYTDTWLFEASSNLGSEDTYFYMYEKGYPSNKVNNRDNILAFWNGGADAGSTINILFAQAEYPVNTSTGEWTASNSNKTWAASWQSNATPHINFMESAGRNNMAAYDGTDNIQLYTCLANAAVNGVHSATYNFTAENGYAVAGYRFNFVSSGSYDVTVTPAGMEGITADAATPQSVEVTGNEEGTLSFTITSSSNMFANTTDFYATIVRSAAEVEESSEIFVTKRGGIPYRIPAIAMAKNGDLIAVADYRHSGADIGVVKNGRIDLLARISKDNGESWGNQFAIVEGQGANSPDFMHVGFGDPCIVADRESNRVLVLSCAGNVSFQSGTRNNHQNIARFYSEDNGATWSEPVDIADDIYSMWDSSTAHGPVMAMFIGSGKIHQSRYVKVNEYYRLYCSVLLKNRYGTYTNFVLYSDDFGGKWDVLGGVETAPIPNGADEPKVEELPNGNIIISSRCNGGRHFNIFTFTDAEKAEGSWGTRATSNASVNGIIAQNNSCNGEILIFPALRREDNTKVWLALQSVPFGPQRTNVGIYYKELTTEADYNTPANFAKDWDGSHKSTTLPSAYSTMCFQSDSTIAFLYEESTYGADYTIIYKNYSLETITDSLYSIVKGESPEVEPEGPSDETIAMIAEAEEILGLEGVGLPAAAPREALQAAIDAAKANPTASEGAKLEAAVENYFATTDVVLPADGKRYSITMVGKNERAFYLNYTGSDIAMVERDELEEELPESAKFICHDNGDGTVTLMTADDKYLVYHSNYNGVSWLQGGGDTDGLQEEMNEMTKITFAKMENGDKVEAERNVDIFGMLTWYSKRGFDTGKNEDCYGYMVLKTDGSNYDGATVPFWNNNFSSGFYLEEYEIPTGIDEVETETGKENGIFDLSGRKIKSITAPGFYIVNGEKVFVK